MGTRTMDASMMGIRYDQPPALKATDIAMHVILLYRCIILLLHLIQTLSIAPLTGWQFAEGTFATSPPFLNSQTLGDAIDSCCHVQ